ncbi:MAG: hypothetical protein JSW34_03775, partial [Candidatus Zixiibacteriota bacterium]
TTIRVVTVVSAVAWIGWGFVEDAVYGTQIRWFHELRYGEDKKRRIILPYNILLGFFLAEVLIGVVYFVAWLFSQ